MNSPRTLSDADLRAIAERGIAPAEIERQLALLRNPPPAVHIVRPARAGDGIRVLSADEQERARSAWRGAADAGRLLAFVPASGAASRMFRALLAERERGAVGRADLERRAAAGDRDAADVLQFVDRLDRFAFLADLERELARRGRSLAALEKEGDFGPAIAALLDDDGLGYAHQAKGLLAFHDYPEGARAAFEEHLVEASRIVRDAHGVARLHFTVSPQHRADFEGLLERIRPAIERRTGTRFDVGFSEQRPSTDTIAIDADGAPFREPDGSLLFRPGGHGSLLSNLAALGADLVIVKNIDNIVPDSRRDVCVRWKQVLAGILVETQARIFDALAALDGEPRADAVDRAIALLERDLACPVPGAVGAGTLAERARFARAKLDRPLRACGMVPASGETGGGPFWVAAADGQESLQIVETAQIDLSDPGQKEVHASATHFNPVDLACALRDRHGRGYDLARHVDPNAAFITEKSSGGRALRALEHPGLWNGAMADWTTIFVEVPLATFNPVKTVNDLLRPEHQHG
ncbi:MAG TPA: DUF4301 family protein [Candidatus Binatia bacterium]|nr:DUF4301 family protein [Candidatus Binatia bacterium]